MAVSDVVSELASVANLDYVTIQPGAGVEWLIHNIYHEDAIELYFYDGTNSLKFEADSSFGAYFGMAIHVTNTHYLRVKNTAASGSKLIGYDGVQTK